MPPAIQVLLKSATVTYNKVV